MYHQVASLLIQVGGTSFNLKQVLSQHVDWWLEELTVTSESCSSSIFNLLLLLWAAKAALKTSSLFLSVWFGMCAVACGRGYFKILKPHRLFSNGRKKKNLPRFGAFCRLSHVHCLQWAAPTSPFNLSPVDGRCRWCSPTAFEQPLWWGFH